MKEQNSPIIEQKFQLEIDHDLTLSEISGVSNKIFSLNKQEIIIPKPAHLSNQWEQDHLNFIFNNWENNCLISFGEWVGPIVLSWDKYMNNHIFNKDKFIIAFDPDPVAFTNLFTNAINKRNIHTYNYCVSNKTEVLNFVALGGSGTSVGSGNFPCYCINYLDLKNKYPNCHYKIDIEGYEEYLIDQIIEDSPNKMSLSIHMPFIKDKELFKEKLEKLEKKYKKIHRIDENYGNFKGEFYELLYS